MFLFRFNDMKSSDWWKARWDNDIFPWIKGPFFKFIFALIVFLICIKIVDVVSKKILKRLLAKNADSTLSRVLFNLLSKGLKVLLFVMFLAYIGIETASISALIASLGVGVGLCLQGALSNFAGGLLIIITRPFRIGDFIEAQGQSGTVEDIHICYTDIVTTTNVVVKIPNGILANGVIVNKSIKDTRRVDEVFSISYDTDFAKAEAIVLDVCAKNSKIFVDPKPFCRLSCHNDSSLDLVCRVWVKSEDYWDVHFYLLEEVFNAFKLNNIEIPFNQLDVNLKGQEEASNQKK